MSLTNIIIIITLILFFVMKNMGQINAEEAKKLIEQGALIVDVRSAAEFSGGSVKNAINIPLDSLKLKIAEVAPDKNKPLLVFCLSGSRSALAKRILSAEGYTNVHNLGSFMRAKSIVE
ncbi:MAG: hypothetical protein Kow0029_11430 [Candidatus Rifleibacteriota bacterium]